MKKLFYILAAVALTMWACQKPAVTPTDEGGKQGGEEQNPDPKPEVKDEITLISDAIVNLPTKDSQQFTVKFTTNAAWTAEADEFITLQKTSGEAGENIEVMAVIQSLGDEEYGRVGGILIKAGKAEARVGIMQGLVFLVDPQKSEIGIEGGKVEFQVISNQEYTVKTYDAADAAFPWAPVTFDQETGMGSLAVEPNGGYDARTAYIKFTVPGIQVPAYDDEGNPTGETEDYVTRFYVYQAGNAQQVWATSLPADFDVTNTDEPVHDATASVAIFNGKVLVSDATKVYAYDPATGAASTVNIPGDLPIQSIASDDAGNLLLATLIPYGGVGSVYAVKATDTQMANPVRLIPWVNGAWAASRGADKVAARGDVFGNGVVTMIYGDSAFSYLLAWEIKDGSADVYDYNEWNKSSHLINGDAWFKSPDITDTIWLSNRAVFVPAGPSVADGFFYSGYDGFYHVYYYDGTQWNTAVQEVGNWAYAPNGMATTTWDGKKILAVVNMAYFPEWGMPSQLFIIDVTDPAKAGVLAITEYTNPAEEHVTGGQESSTTSVILGVEGNDLTATVVDSAWGIVFKEKYPKL